MQYGLQKLRSGASGLVNAMLGDGSPQSHSAYGQELARLYKADTYAADARKTTAEADLATSRLRALEGLEGSIGPVLQSYGVAADALPGYASLLRAGQGNASALVEALARGSAAQRASDAVGTYQGGNADLANFMLQAAGEKAYQPYQQSAQGSVLNQATGAVDQSSPLAMASIASERALAGERGAGAGAAQALARERDQAAALNQAKVITEGLRPDLVRAQTSAENAQAMQRYADASRPGGTGKPSAATEKLNVLLARGVPADLAEGIAYGTIKSVRDPMGMRTQFIDIASGTVVAEVDSKGVLHRNQNIYGGAPAPGGAPMGGGTAPNDPDGIRALLLSP